jgi:hypothetical protein
MSAVVYPYIAQINAHEALVFVRCENAPPPCAFCRRARAETLRVASGGTRIEAIYSRGHRQGNGFGTAPGDPICWTCIREKAHGALGSPGEWRSAAARFLNELNASDPQTLYCEIRSLA